MMWEPVSRTWIDDYQEIMPVHPSTTPYYLDNVQCTVLSQRELPRRNKLYRVTERSGRARCVSNLWQAERQ